MRLSPIFAVAVFAPAAAAAQPILLEDIVLSANRAESLAARTGSSVSVLTTGDLESDGRPFVLQQITDLPGVTVAQNGPAGTVSGFAVRGAPQQYVRVLVEGIEISDPTGTQVAPSLSSFLVDDVSRIEVLKGSQSALYGGQAVGGVISITTPRADGPGIESRLIAEGGSFSTFRGGYTVAGQDDRGEFALSLARFQTDGFSAAEEADGNTEDDGYETTRISASGTRYATDQSSLFAAAFWQQDEGEFDSGPGAGGDAPNTFEGTSWGTRAGVDFTTQAGLENTLALSYFDVDRTQKTVDPVFGAATFDTKGDRGRAEYVGSYAFSEALTLQFGADYTREETRTRYVSPGFVGESGTERTWIAGAFAQATWSPAEPLTLDAALRYDEHSEFGGYPTGRLTTAYLATPDTTIRGSLGTGFRAPSNFELFDAFSGNPDLEPETSLSADLGVARRFAAGQGQVSATVFWLEIDDLIEYDFATDTYSQSDGTARSQGLEIAAIWEIIDQVTLAGSYTYTDAEQPNGARRDRIPRHDVALTVAGAATDRISYDVGAQFVFDFIDDSVTIGSEGFAEDYVLFNARLAYAVTATAEVYLRAENILDQQYQTARGYSTADRAVYAGVAARF